MEETTRIEAGQGETAQDGVTLSAVVGAVLRARRLAVILLLTIVAAVGSFFVMKFGINPRKIWYEVSFGYSLAKTVTGREDMESGQFFSEPKTLSFVKSTDDKFGGLDLELVERRGSAVYSVTKTVADKEGNAAEYPFLLRIKATLLPDEDAVHSFAKRLAAAPIDYMKADSEQLTQTDADGFNGYEPHLRSFAAASTYEEKISLLKAQRDYLVSIYNGWISAYGETYYIQGKGKSLSDLRAAAEAAFSDDRVNELNRQMEAYRFVPVEGESDAELAARLATYEAQRKLNDEKIAQLQKQLDALLEKYEKLGSSASALLPQFGDFHARIAALAEENAVLDRNIAALQPNGSRREEYLQEERKFSASLAEICGLLDAEAKNCAESAAEICEEESFVSVGECTVTGGTNALFVAFAVAVVMFLVACAVCCAVVFHRKKPAGVPHVHSDDAVGK